MNNQMRVMFRGRWKALAPREQRMLIGVAVFLASLLVWSLLIRPPLKDIEYWQTETPKLRAQNQALELLLGEVTTLAGPSIEQSLQQSLDTAGLAGRYRLQARDASWQLTFAQAPADVVIAWLLNYPNQFSLEVVEARLRRAGEVTADNTAGTLSGTVRMDQMQGAKEAS
ncbi:type II secretion system protein GspM [Pseudomonas sp. FP597]|uniref:Type II secretion system protein M n=1 Tax=Pseudomonas lactucae TaxID=2813360 RepID=A0A9X0YB16_9PSED|nr:MULTISPECIES: type II secretion system protein GspM [Pseudomonas]MBN2975939.1 type II secretion system protein M [Pseudomonas lactucae]MBN2985647.1 type II secretion system protein M [Pseudomonas lactucae]WLI08975.1 type II secretion system protein GspM [Pseudomonas sp. FP597]